MNFKEYINDEEMVSEGVKWDGISKDVSYLGSGDIQYPLGKSGNTIQFKTNYGPWTYTVSNSDRVDIATGEYDPSADQTKWIKSIIKTMSSIQSRIV